jgi:ABC-type Zn uptake system ZnuABC Zn-binding protein ZnuA
MRSIQALRRQTRPLIIRLPILALLIVIVASGCSPDPGRGTSREEAFLTSITELEPINLDSEHKLHVVASTSIVYDVLQNIGGEAIDLEMLIPIGADPHAYEPTPGDLRKLVQADLVFINGIDLEEPLYPTFSEIAANTVIASLSEGLQLQSFAGETGKGTDPHDQDSGDQTGMDPHVWLDPLNVRTWVINAADALSAVDPDRAEQYLSNAEAYSGQLDELHGWIEVMVAGIPADQRKLVTDHRALGYFAARYGFELIATVVPAYSTAAEPSARELADLVETIKNESAQAIFVSSNVNTTIAKRIAEDTGIRVVPLYIGTLSPAEGPADSYIEMMEYNVEAISATLAGNNN